MSQILRNKTEHPKFRVSFALPLLSAKTSFFVYFVIFVMGGMVRKNNQDFFLLFGT